jgi:hypothetical protein
MNVIKRSKSEMVHSFFRSLGIQRSTLSLPAWVSTESTSRLFEFGQDLYVFLSTSIFGASFVTLIIDYGNHARLLPSRTGIRHALRCFWLQLLLSSTHCCVTVSSTLQSVQPTRSFPFVLYTISVPCLTIHQIAVWLYYAPPAVGQTVLIMHLLWTCSNNQVWLSRLHSSNGVISVSLAVPFIYHMY